MVTDSTYRWSDFTYRALSSQFFEDARPTPVKAPSLIVFNSPIAHELGLDFFSGRADLLSGSAISSAHSPIAQAYAGHQFGHFTKLGDGRAHLLGEFIAPSGQRYDLQLKGSGRTSFSRQGDGRAALGPMLREYLISEAMHAFRIPTTRSLSVVATGEPVFRERALPGAILARIAKSHLRVGTFEYALAWGGPDAVKELADYAIQRHFPHLPQSEDIYRQFLRSFLESQATLIANWMRVGFIHGVMNTDNVSISGETIDYGPCAFMDVYDPSTVFSSIDRDGRYAFSNQPVIAHWNSVRLAECLIPILSESESRGLEVARTEVDRFPEIFESVWTRVLAAKLGIPSDQALDFKAIEAIYARLLTLMHEHHADYTLTFRCLTEPQLGHLEPFTATKDFAEWKASWKTLLRDLKIPQEESVEILNATNPRIIPRNHLVERALREFEGGEPEFFFRLLVAIQSPYWPSTESDGLFERPPSSKEQVFRTFCGT